MESTKRISPVLGFRLRIPKEISMGLTFVTTCTATEITNRIFAANIEPPKYGRVKVPGVVDMKESI